MTTNSTEGGGVISDTASWLEGIHQRMTDRLMESLWEMIEGLTEATIRPQDRPEAGSKQHNQPWLSSIFRWWSNKKRKKEFFWIFFFFWLATLRITMGLIGWSEQKRGAGIRLPGNSPVASHRLGSEEPCLNYRLATHPSVTNRNQV